MKIIDAHLHLSNIALFRKTAREISYVDYSPNGLSMEMAENNIIAAIGMGLRESLPGTFPDQDAPSPMLLDMEPQSNAVFCCAGVNPVSLERGDTALELERLKEATESPQVVGLKLYPGYYHYPLTDPVYDGVYTLAEERKLPIVIHGGDTYSPKGILKYSHPLNVNEIAVRHPQVTFVIAHFGNPWVLDTGVIITNQDNVYADLSGLILGGVERIHEFRNEPLLMNYIKTGILYSGNYHKILFGTDWPLVPIGEYTQFVADLIPYQYHDFVFYRNSLAVFTKLAAAI